MESGSPNPAGHGDPSQPSKIVLKTKSETEPLEDGYSWKKYGQKFIKNSAHPRSYFRCKHSQRRGCPVKKQSERCLDEPEFVLTTYLGIHNHQPNPGSAPTSPAATYSNALGNAYDLRSQMLRQAGNEYRPPENAEAGEGGTSM